MGAQVLEETVTDNETKVAAKASTVLVEKRDGRVVDFDPINIISAVKSAFGDLNKEVGPEEDAMIRGFADQVEGEIKERYTGPAKIEDIQNLVEHALIDASPSGRWDEPPARSRGSSARAPGPVRRADRRRRTASKE